MRRFRTAIRPSFLVILAWGMGVLVGCQQTTIESSQAVANPEPERDRDQARTPVLAGNASSSRTSPETSGGASRSESPARVASPVGYPTPPGAVHASHNRTLSSSSPENLTVPAGALMSVELDRTLSSHTSHVGEGFRAILRHDVLAQGEVALPRDAVVVGRVTEAKPAKKVGGRARLSLEFYALHLPSGQQVPLRVVFAETGKSQASKDAAIIGGSTLGGAILGRAVDRGEGTAIGAIVGGLAGAAIANETRAKRVEVLAGTVLTLELVQPVTVEPMS